MTESNIVPNTEVYTTQEDRAFWVELNSPPHYTHGWVAAEPELYLDINFNTYRILGAQDRSVLVSVP